MILEYEDIKQFMPVLIKDLRESIDKEVFIKFPGGLMKHYGVSRTTVWKLWNKEGFPRVQVEGVKGVYLSELKEFERKNPR